MNEKKIHNILFSRALLLTYIFIGYLSLADNDSPTCSVDSVPECSKNDLAYPSVQTFHVSMAEHVRSFEPANVKQYGVVYEIDRNVQQTSWTVAHADYIPLVLFPVSSEYQSRAPPAFIL